MDDLISRRAAITVPVMPKEYREYQTYNLDDAYEQGWFDLQKCIENLPSAQLESETGEWINKKPRWIGSLSMTVQDAYECSNCGEAGVNWWKYCIYCGAPMEIEEWRKSIIERWRNER